MHELRRPGRLWYYIPGIRPNIHVPIQSEWLCDIRLPSWWHLQNRFSGMVPSWWIIDFHSSKLGYLKRSYLHACTLHGLCGCSCIWWCGSFMSFFAHNRWCLRQMDSSLNHYCRSIALISYQCNCSQNVGYLLFIVLHGCLLDWQIFSWVYFDHWVKCQTVLSRFTDSDVHRRFMCYSILLSLL